MYAHKRARSYKFKMVKNKDKFRKIKQNEVNKLKKKKSYEYVVYMKKLVGNKQ